VTKKQNKQIIKETRSTDYAKKQRDLKRIKKETDKKLICELKNEATNIVFGKGNPNAKIMFIGEAPGKKEDLQGEPFVGKAGKELDKLLNSIGLTLKDVYITNILKYRPPKNRNPSLNEIKTHTPYLIKQIQTIKPQIICTLGNYATKFALSGFKPENMNKIKGITTLHGEVQEINNLKIYPLYHPAATLYNPKLRKTLEQDFSKLQELLKKI